MAPGGLRANIEAYEAIQDELEREHLGKKRRLPGSEARGCVRDDGEGHHARTLYVRRRFLPHPPGRGETHDPAPVFAGLGADPCRLLGSGTRVSDQSHALAWVPGATSMLSVTARNPSFPWQQDRSVAPPAAARPNRSSRTAPLRAPCGPRAPRQNGASPEAMARTRHSPSRPGARTAPHGFAAGASKLRDDHRRTNSAPGPNSRWTRVYQALDNGTRWFGPRRGPPGT